MTPISSQDALLAALHTARLQVQTQRSPAIPAERGDTSVFSDALQSASAQIHRTETDAARAVTGLLSGEGVEVHEAMMATQRAELQFELALQVRNKAVAAYQQMMQMQF